MSNPTPSYNPLPQQLPNCNIKGSMRVFGNYEAYEKYYDGVIPSQENNGGMNMSYSELYDFVLNMTENDKIGSPQEAIKWLGDTYPKSLNELFSRDEYQSMNEYSIVYENNIKSRLNEIMKESSALLDLPTLRYNDLGLGIFDFSKASLGLVPLYEYYALKHKEYVEGYDTKVIKEDGKFVTKLKKDNSDVVLVPQLKKGYDPKVVDKAFKEIFKGSDVFATLKKYDLKIGKFTSSIKKTFLYKENVPKPLKAVRIFIYVGGNCYRTGEEFKWTGYTGIGVAELLISLGYNVSVHAIFGTGNSQCYIDGSFQMGIRASAVTLKGFSETTYSKRLLYVTSDPSFFRGKEFIKIIKKSQEYSDYMDEGLGYSISTQDVKCLAYQQFGKIDKMWNKDGSHNTQSGMLYYVIGNITNEQMMNQEILNIGLNVVNENKDARDRLGYISI
jgi:hypothetical protein